MAEKFDNPNYNPEAGMKYLATHFEMFKPEVAKAMIADAKRKGVKIPPVVEAKARKAGILNSVRVAMNYVNPKFPDLRYAKIVSEMAEAVAKTGGAEGNAAATDIARGSVAAFIIDDLKEAERRLTHELSVFPSWASLDLENKKIYDEALRKTKLKLEAIKRLLPKAKAMVANSVRNADTPEARKIIERAKGRFAAIKDPGQLANVRDDILRGISRSSAIPDDEKDAIEGEVIYLHGQALRKLGFNSVRSTNAVVAKALAMNGVAGKWSDPNAKMLKEKNGWQLWEGTHGYGMCRSNGHGGVWWGKVSRAAAIKHFDKFVADPIRTPLTINAVRAMNWNYKNQYRSSASIHL